MRCASVLLATSAHSVVGSCRQNVPAVDLRMPPAIASGDAFGLDQTDRDHPRDFWKPSVRTDGYKPDSKRNSIDRVTVTLDIPGSGAF